MLRARLCGSLSASSSEYTGPAQMSVSLRILNHSSRGLDLNCAAKCALISSRFDESHWCGMKSSRPMVLQRLAKKCGSRLPMLIQPPSAHS